MTSADTLDIVSTSANDTLAGTGARVKVFKRKSKIVNRLRQIENGRKAKQT